MCVCDVHFVEKCSERERESRRERDILLLSSFCIDFVWGCEKLKFKTFLIISPSNDKLLLLHIFVHFILFIYL